MRSHFGKILNIPLRKANLVKKKCRNRDPIKKHSGGNLTEAENTPKTGSYLRDRVVQTWVHTGVG